MLGRIYLFVVWYSGKHHMFNIILFCLNQYLEKKSLWREALEDFVQCFWACIMFGNFNGLLKLWAYGMSQFKGHAGYIQFWDYHFFTRLVIFTTFCCTINFTSSSTKSCLANSGSTNYGIKNSWWGKLWSHVRMRGKYLARTLFLE